MLPPKMLRECCPFGTGREAARQLGARRVRVPRTNLTPNKDESRSYRSYYLLGTEALLREGLARTRLEISFKLPCVLPSRHGHVGLQGDRQIADAWWKRPVPADVAVNSAAQIVRRSNVGEPVRKLQKIDVPHGGASPPSLLRSFGGQPPAPNRLRVAGLWEWPAFSWHGWPATRSQRRRVVGPGGLEPPTRRL